ncbi:uncharacterized protein LOC132547055 [Ylistrum balloti]|uniref:uncharacterized protein LOC132547055 n=1 Tax=Ylistrum balloti TaxID=509963 RepID=UPI0029057E7E|nr:uncharacterized protein LOC132547055 [Ylistrum balloti]
MKDFRICVVTLFFIVNTIKIVYGHCSSVTVPLSFFAQENKTLTGFTYRRITHVPNVQICAKNCLLHRKCRSINYNSDLLDCELNSADHLGEPQALSTSVTSQYYIIDGWPELLLGGCQQHSCPATHVCEDQFLSVDPTFRCVEYEISTTTPLSPTIGCTNLLPAVSEVIANSELVTFSPVACVYSPGMTFETLLHNYRNGQFNWFNLQPVIDGCAVLAHTNSYKYFGIEFYGECWVGNDFVESSHEMIPADQCDSKTYRAVGTENVICVYEVL